MKETNSSNLQHEVVPDEENRELIEKEKNQYADLSAWASKPKYKMPETITERLKRYLRELFTEKPRICKIHGLEYREHGYDGFFDCTECRREYYSEIRI